MPVKESVRHHMSVYRLLHIPVVSNLVVPLGSFKG
jgi:hypothetical protein